MTKNSELLFAPELDQPVRYIERTRNYYLGLGYETPYVWAHYIDVPFTPLQKPPFRATITFIPFVSPRFPLARRFCFFAFSLAETPRVRALKKEVYL